MWGHQSVVHYHDSHLKEIWLSFPRMVVFPVNSSVKRIMNPFFLYAKMLLVLILWNSYMDNDSWCELISGVVLPCLKDAVLCQLFWTPRSYNPWSLGRGVILDVSLWLFTTIADLAGDIGQGDDDGLSEHGQQSGSGTSQFPMGGIGAGVACQLDPYGWLASCWG